MTRMASLACLFFSPSPLDLCVCPPTSLPPHSSPHKKKIQEEGVQVGSVHTYTSVCLLVLPSVPPTA